MRANLIFLACMMGFGIVNAQEVNCPDKQKEFAQFVNDGKYKQANEVLPLLRKKCAAQNESMYPLGITLLNYNVAMASGEAKQAAVTDLVKFYDQYDANFPGNKNGNLVQKAMLLHDNQLGTEAEIYNYLNKAFTANPDQFKNANALFLYFRLYHENYKTRKDIPLDQLLGKYGDVMAALEKNAASSPDKQAEFDNAKIASKALVKELLKPEALIAMAEKKFEANKQDILWLESTAALLSDKAAASPIFGKIATQLHSLKPSAQSAYHLANFNLKNRNPQQAVVYFEQSASLAPNASEKAKTYYTTATILAGSNREQARKMLLLAMENNPKNGSYYLFLSNMYVNSIEECGATGLQQKAIYQLAGQTAQKAGQVEPKLKASAEQLLKEYAKNSPSKAELDQIKKEGGKVMVGCWIQETVLF